MKKTHKWLSAMLVLTMITSIFSGATAAAATTPYIKSDTPSTLSLEHNDTYTFKMTMNGNTKGTPSFSAGNSSVLSVRVTGHVGNNYYVQIEAIGQPSQSTGVYSKLPGQSPVRQTVVSIKLHELLFPQELDWQFYHTCNEKFAVKQWTGNTVNTALLGDGEFSGVKVTITNSNPNVVALSIGSKGTPAATVTTNATTAEKFNELYSYIHSSDWSVISNLSDSEYYSVKGVNPGTAIITITAKSPKTGEVLTDVHVHTILSPSSMKVTTSAPTEITLAKGQSYTFECQASSEAAASGVDFSVEGTVYTDYYDEEEAFKSYLQQEIVDKGDGKYSVTITALPLPGIQDGYLKTGDKFILTASVPGVASLTLGTITIQ